MFVNKIIPAVVVSAFHAMIKGDGKKNFLIRKFRMKKQNKIRHLPVIVLINFRSQNGDMSRYRRCLTINVAQMNTLCAK